MEKKRITVHTEQVNRYGFRVLTKGLSTANFERNPVMYFGHATSGLPIGTWSDLQKHDNGDMDAVPNFDEITELSKLCKSMYDAGTLRAASIHFQPNKFSDAAEDVLPGQQAMTVTESDLLEISIAGIPINPGATLSLYALSNSAIPPITTNTPAMDLKKIALALGLPESADEAAVLAAIKDQNNLLKTLQDANVENCLALGKSKGVITAENEPHYRKMAAIDAAALRQIFDTAKAEIKDVLETPKPEGKTITGMLSTGGVKPQTVNPDGREGWSFDEWSQKDSKGLALMRKNDPDRYTKLAVEKYETA